LHLEADTHVENFLRLKSVRREGCTWA